jgi:hypothetical protein
MALLVVVFVVLSSISSTRSSMSHRFADYTTWVFVFEVILKIGCYGVKGYWSDIWNRVDCMITCTSLAALITDAAIVDSAEIDPILQAVRLLRVLKLMSVLNSLGRYEKNGLFKDGYYTKLLESLAATIPVCLNMLLLQFFYVFMFAMIGLEILASAKANTRTMPANGEIIDFSGSKINRYDWSGTQLDLNLDISVARVAHNAIGSFQWSNDVVYFHHLSYFSPLTSLWLLLVVVASVCVL